MNQPIDGYRLLLWLVKLGWTSTDLASKLDKTPRTIQGWIDKYSKGEVVNVQYRNFVALEQLMDESKYRKKTGMGPECLKPDLESIDMYQLTLWQEKLGLSRESLAEELGVAPSTIKIWKHRHAKGKVVNIQYRTYVILEQLMRENQKETGMGPECLKPEPKEPGGDRHDSDEGQPTRADCNVDEVPRKTPSSEPEFELNTLEPEPVREVPVRESFQRKSRNSHSSCALAGAVGAMAAIGVLLSTTTLVLENRDEVSPQPVPCELGVCPISVELEDGSTMEFPFDELSDRTKAILVSDLALRAWFQRRS